MRPNWIIFFIPLVLTAGCLPPLYNQEGQIRIGTLQTIGPDVRLEGKPETGHLPVYSSDRIETGKNSSGYLYFKNGGFIQLGENTDPEFYEIWEGTKCFIIMIKQLIGVSYYESEDGQCALQFQNQTAEAVRQGTKVIFKVTQSHTIITVHEGSMLLTYPHEMEIQKGYQAKISQKGLVEMHKLSDSALKDTVKWRKKFPSRIPPTGRPLVPTMIRPMIPPKIPHRHPTTISPGSLDGIMPVGPIR